jgi:hypothetical protein
MSFWGNGELSECQELDMPRQVRDHMLSNLFFIEIIGGKDVHFLGL